MLVITRGYRQYNGTVSWPNGSAFSISGDELRSLQIESPLEIWGFQSENHP